MSNQRIKVGIAVLLLSVTVGKPVSANNPLTNIASEVTQVLNFGQLVLQYARQVDQFRNQVQRLDHMIDQARNFNAEAFLANPMGLVNQVRDITRQGQSIGYAVANVEQVITQRYKGYDEFVLANYDRATFVDDYANWTKTTQDSIGGALRAAGVLMESVADEEVIMQQLQARVTNADTRQQALQVASEVNLINGRQLGKLRELMAANMQVQSAFFQAQSSEEAARAAGRQKYFNPDPADQALPPNDDGRAWTFP